MFLQRHCLKGTAAPRVHGTSPEQLAHGPLGDNSLRQQPVVSDARQCRCHLRSPVLALQEKPISLGKPPAGP